MAPVRRPPGDAGRALPLSPALTMVWDPGRSAMAPVRHPPRDARRVFPLIPARSALGTGAVSDGTRPASPWDAGRAFPLNPESAMQLGADFNYWV